MLRGRNIDIYCNRACSYRKHKKGDFVYSKDPKTGMNGIKKAEHVSVLKSHIIYHIQFGNEMIGTTAEPLFLVFGKGFINAEYLETGDEILVALNENKDNFETAEITNSTKSLHEDQIPVYNFVVEDWHTYYAGKNNIFVHN